MRNGQRRVGTPRELVGAEMQCRRPLEPRLHKRMPNAMREFSFRSPFEHIGIAQQNPQLSAKMLITSA